MEAVVYSKENCPYCTKAKHLLTKMGVEYTEFIIKQPTSSMELGPNQSWVSREELLAAAPNAKTVPQIWLDGEYIGGYDSLSARYPSYAVNL